MNIEAHSYYMSHSAEIIAAHGRVAFQVCVSLAWSANAESNDCFPSMKTIARNTGYSVTSIKKALPKLKRARLLCWSNPGGGSNRYTFPFVKAGDIAQDGRAPIETGRRPSKRRDRVTLDEVREIVRQQGRPIEYVDQIMRELIDCSWHDRRGQPITDARAYVSKFLIRFIDDFNSQNNGADAGGIALDDIPNVK